MNKDKEAGKFAWFCLGTLFAWTSISKLTHFVYWVIIAILFSQALPQCTELTNRLVQ